MKLLRSLKFIACGANWTLESLRFYIILSFAFYLFQAGHLIPYIDETKKEKKKQKTDLC